MRQIQFDLPYHCMFVVPSVRRSGGLALLWKEEADLHIQTYSPYHIDALIHNGKDPTWRLIGFYGWPKQQNKHESWRLLKHLHSRLPDPWLCCGDFNEILHSWEKQGSLPKPLQLMQEFRSTLLCCGLLDLGFQGNKYTWNNGRPAGTFG